MIHTLLFLATELVGNIGMLPYVGGWVHGPKFVSTLVALFLDGFS